MRAQYYGTELADICDVRVGDTLTQFERVAEYVRQIKDPRHFKCGEYTVTAIYDDDGPTLEDCLQPIIQRGRQSRRERQRSKSAPTD